MDATKKAVSAEAMAIVVQPNEKTQGLLSSKAWLTKQGLRMPRQELVSCQMGASIATNTNSAPKGFTSKVDLFWLTKAIQKQECFVANRVHKTEEISRSLDVTWRYVPTDISHADYMELGLQQWKSCSRLNGGKARLVMC